MTVVVIGTGLAGITAALSARAAGAEVVVVGDRPGATALWSGVAEAYGPIYDRVDYQDPLHRPHLVTTGQPPLEDRDARLARLMRRRSFHPYARLDLSPDDLAARLRQAAETLAVELSWATEPRYVANAHGTVRLADGAWPSVAAGRLGADAHYCVIGLEHYPAFDPEAAARALESQGLHARAGWVEVDGAALAQSPALASARLEALDDDALTGLGAQIAAAAGKAVALLPPILGRRPEAHRRIMTAVTQGADEVALAEVAAIHKSLHGFRLQLGLEAGLETAGVRRVRERIAEIETRDGRVVAAATASGERLDCDSLVLATGRAVGGGIRRESPLAETLLGLPLYIEGAPIEPGQYPPELATRRLFDDHPLFRVGVGISPRLQPLGPDARPAFENLYAAGLVIGGTDFTRDGTAFGVGLITGWLAGRRAAGAEV